MLAPSLPSTSEGCYLPDIFPFPGVKAPRVEPPMVHPLTDNASAHVPRRAESTDQALHRCRDEAVIRLMLETAIRSVRSSRSTSNVDLGRWLVTIRRGNGGRGRIIPIGPGTALAIEHNFAVRSRHPLAGRPALWLGDRGSATATTG